MGPRVIEVDSKNHVVWEISEVEDLGVTSQMNALTAG